VVHGPFGWVLASPHVLRFKPCRGKIGLFDAPEI
jgi:hypothetical protein